MHRTFNSLLAAAIVVSAAACSETTSPNSDAFSLTDVYTSTIAGYGNTLNSFSADSGLAFGMHGGPGGHDGHHGPRGGDFGVMGGLMGGMGDIFRGIGFGGPGGHGGHGGPGGVENLTGCTFNATSGRVECPAETRNGLTTTKSVAFTTASGTAQSAFDTLTTNTINTKIAVSGTVTRRDSAVSNVSSSSDRTVTGLAAGSTKRTINGTSAGTETTTGKDSAGVSFTVVRVNGDTVKNVVVPARAATDTVPPYPTSGTVIRSMKATKTSAGTTTSTSRREVVTYDGTSAAKVEITQDGTTKSCTVALPHGRLTCS